jgi:beta-glucosidase
LWQARATGELDMYAVDRNTQEDSLRLGWRGNGVAGFSNARGADFSFETNADMLLVISARVDAVPEGEVSVGVACGTGCQASVPLTAELRAMPAGQWLRLGIPLKCFARAGADMARPITRFELRGTGRALLTVNRIALGTDVDRRANCAVQ